MEWLLNDYWPWWLSACALATATLGMWLVERRLLGVSGHYTEAVRHRTAEEQRLEQADAQTVEDAMLQATLAEFGPEAVEAFKASLAKESAIAVAAPEPLAPMARSVHVTFLVMLAAGGFVGALVRGGWEVQTELDPVHASLTGGGVKSLLVLIAGGVLVGFGTRMAGGCTSGHGLSGTSRLQPGSLVTTASFLGAAIAVSYLLEALL